MINEYMRKSFLLVAGLFLSLSEIPAQTPQWPEAGIESKAGSRWWLMGSAVDQQNLVMCMDDYAKAGIGTLEITPIYGVHAAPRCAGSGPRPSAGPGRSRLP